MKPTAIAVIALLLSGCIIVGPDGDHWLPDTSNLVNYKLVMHPPALTWSEEKQRFDGFLRFSNLFPAESNVTIELEELYISSGLHGLNDNLKEGGEYEHYTADFVADQDIYVPAGKTLQLNFTLPNPKFYRQSIDDETVPFEVGRVDTAIVFRSAFQDPATGPGKKTSEVIYNNFCLFLEDGQLQQDRGTREKICNPEEPWEGTHYYYQIDGNTEFPPLEDWATWTDDDDIPLARFPDLRPAVEFLRNYHGENLVYFHGRISR